MTGIETDICAHLASEREAMLALLDQLVSTDSGSRDAAGVSAVSGRIAAFLSGRGVAVETIESGGYGDARRARIVGANPGAPVVLMGHCDTVFSKGEAARRPFRIEDGRAYGPGVADMKAGLVMNAFVLAALRKFGAPTDVTGLFTVDEEIASPWSRSLIERTARGARAAFNAEPARPDGSMVTSRNGGLFFRIEIAGKAAHSGMNFAAGVSAVSEAARKIAALDALTDLRRGVTANAGVVGGGTTFNTVAANAFVEAELRYRDRADRDRVRAEVERIVATRFVPGTEAVLTVHGEFPPMEELASTQALVDLYATAAAQTGFQAMAQFSGGCSDAGFLTLNDVPTLCAIGPVGGHAHTEQEYVEVETMVPRAQALALSILRLPRLRS